MHITTVVLARHVTGPSTWTGGGHALPGELCPSARRRAGTASVIRHSSPRAWKAAHPGLFLLCFRPIPHFAWQGRGLYHHELLRETHLYCWAATTCTGVPSAKSPLGLVMSASAPLRPELISISVP
jgi:hypothetical protein